MILWFPITIFVISLAAILWSGHILPRSMAGISRMLGASEFVTAFLLVSFATSVPELFIGISSALQGVPTISLGNVLGSNFANLTFVLGASALFMGHLKRNGQISSQNFWLIFLIAFLPILLATDGIISRGDGVLLLIAFGLYIAKLFRDKEYFHRALEETPGAKQFTLRSAGHVIRQSWRFVGGAILLLVSAFGIIWSAQVLADAYFGSNVLLFGVVIIALGTSLPELVFGIQAARDNRSEASIGNALGSVAFNAVAIVGVTAVISPLTINFAEEVLLTAGFLFVAFLLFHWFVYTRKRLNRIEGTILLTLYVVFLFIFLSQCASCILEAQTRFGVENYTTLLEAFK